MSTPKKFRKKPLVVEAMLYVGDENYNSVREFVGHARPLHQLGDGNIGIETLEGVMNVTPGSWIIKGVKGEFYPCKADIFAATYEGEVNRKGWARLFVTDSGDDPRAWVIVTFVSLATLIAFGLIVPLAWLCRVWLLYWFSGAAK